MRLNVRVTKRIAKYERKDDYLYVLGSKGDTVKFIFDDEWRGKDYKTARFVVNGKYTDVEFNGDECEIPFLEDAKEFYVGVYFGEPSEDEDALSTTKATIPCTPSVRSNEFKASPSTGQNYTNEAKGYAQSAKASAEVAKNAVSDIEKFKGMEKIGTLSVGIEFGYDSNGMEEAQIGGVAACGGILPLSAHDEENDFAVYCRYSSEIYTLFENARIVELTIDTKNGYLQEPVHKEICKGGHMWYGAPKRIYDEMEDSVIGLGVYDKNEGTHLVYADAYDGGYHLDLRGLALSDGALDCLSHESATVGATLTFTSYR